MARWPTETVAGMTHQELAAGFSLLLLGLAATFQGALALGAPWGRYAYGGRTATDHGRLPARLRVTSSCTVVVLAMAGWAVHANITGLLWPFAVLFTLNTVANLTGKHPIERWGMSAITLGLAGALWTLAMT
jgi:hypothetical protein